ncbi:MFS transporter [Antrihabitans cavernicola]|uniref:MFS transporter n=2 Tax=Antrihabitans cavernicola TaxID=2495913 RepID=A0A5A7S5I3_9NOCA|nr:MFS transporter [Spelaeibacter cavernicola]
MLPVVPLALSLNGSSDAVAGASTAVFMAATVASQLGTPRVLCLWGYRAVLALGCALLGPPALLLLLSVDPVPALVVSAVRGIGFGLLTVSVSALIAELAPPALLGRASALNGISAAAAQMVGLPVGLALVQQFSTGSAFVVGAVVPIVSVAAVWLLPDVRPAGTPPGERRERLPGTVLLAPCLAMVVVAAAFGGFSSLAPIAAQDKTPAASIALVLLSAAMVVGRYVSGALSDRIGPGRMLLPSLLVASAGAVLLAVAVRGEVSTVFLSLGAVALGLGFGICQNDSLVTVFSAAGPRRFGAASAAWNIAYDGGTGIGALSLGVAATLGGFPIAFLIAAVVVLAATPITLKR